MMRSMQASVIAILLCLNVAQSASADVVLIADGHPHCAILVDSAVMAAGKKLPAKVRDPETEAEVQRQRLQESVKDLALYLEKMSGAKVEVLTGDLLVGDSRIPILIGVRAAAFGPPAKSAPYKQGFRMVVSPKALAFVGESDLATSYAIYELLDRLGCRWYMPGDMGEVVPEHKTIAMKETDYSYAPGTIYRGIWYCDDAYARRNRHGGLKLSAGHALEMYITPGERKQHPEWVAEVRGQPSPKRLKWSSATLADAIAEKILARHAAHAQPSYSLSPDDGHNWDESAADRALDAGDFDPTMQLVSKTDRLLVLCNRIAERVTAKDPDVLFGMLAYVDYTRPPVREKVHPNIVPQLAPITYSRAHPMTDDRVPGNKELRYLVEGWGKKAKQTSMYFYGYFLAEPSAPNPMITKWSTDVPIVLANNCKFWQPETTPNFETSMHALYLGCRLAWDPSLKPADVINELHAKFYGAAAREMAAYWNFIDGVWVNTPEYSGCGFGYLRRWTPERMQEARRLMNAGIAAAARTPGEKQRVQLADDSLKLFEQFMKLRRDQAEGRFENLADDAAAWRKHILELATQYKDQNTFTKTRFSKPTVAGSYFSQFYQVTYDDASRIAKQYHILTNPPVRHFRYRTDEEKSGEAAGWSAADFNDSAWKQTDVCTETWSSLGYHDYHKSMWYRTTIDLPATPAGKKLFLWIGSTDGTAKVFINGKHVPYADEKGQTLDEAKGYCKPFSFDISGAAKPGAKNSIAILTTRVGFNELGTGGLLAPVVVYAER